MGLNLGSGTNLPTSFSAGRGLWFCVLGQQQQHHQQHGASCVAQAYRSESDFSWQQTTVSLDEFCQNTCCSWLCLKEMDPKCRFGGWGKDGGICMNPKGFTLVPVTALCAGLCTSATLSCGVKMSESSSCIICCPSMLWISSASPTPSLTQVSQPVSVSLFLYTNLFSDTGQSGACVCLSVSVH